MNINKLFEGQRHDEEKAVELVSIVARYAHPDTRDMVWKACHEAIDQYAEHFLVKFLDSEIERLEREKKQDRCNKEEECPWCERNMYCRGREDAIGYNASITDQITHLQDIKRQLTESK